MKRTKIVATVGPACDSLEMLEQMALEGVNVFRLNFSHGNHEEHGVRIDRIKSIRQKLGRPLAIMLDTKGPEIRIGLFENGPVVLEKGQEFTLTTRDIPGNKDIVSITYKGLPADVTVGSTILIDDGLVGMKVEAVNETEIRCRVVNGGKISDRKGVNVPGVEVKLPSITEKDTDDILFGIKQGVDLISASFVRTPEDILQIRRLLQENGGGHIHIISKIECVKAVENLDAIIRVSDGVMVARGDLGVEVAMQQVPIIQKSIIKKCKELGHPVIVATQLLDSMMRNPRPTRAEVNDVATAVYDQCDCVMLSGETAGGQYPIEAVRAMAAICKSVEENMTGNQAQTQPSAGTIAEAVAHACCQCAVDISAKAIITITSGGYTANMIARHRPNCQLIAVTHKESTYYNCALIWGTNALLIEECSDTDALMDSAVDAALQANLIADGDMVLLTAGIPLGVSGSTNMMKAHIVGDVLAKGVAIGSGEIQGRICLAHSVYDCQQNFRPGDILLTKATDHDYLPFMRLASAIICEEDNINCHAAVVGAAIGIPVLMAAHGATETLKNGSMILLDANRGLVLNSQP